MRQQALLVLAVTVSVLLPLVIVTTVVVAIASIAPAEPAFAASPAPPAERVPSHDLFGDRVVGPFSSDAWDVEAEAGRPVRLEVIGDGDSDLDLYLFDQDGILVDADTGPSDVCFVEIPDNGTPLRAVVVNRGPFPSAYVVRTR